MELFFVALLVLIMAGALGMGFPVAFALPGAAILTIGVASLTGAVFAGDVGAYFAQDGPVQWLTAGVTNFRGVYWEVERDTLIAVPLFVFMGIMLQRSKIAEDLLVTMAQLFGPVPGGLGISVVFVGALLAATTGIVGATVVAMGLISLPAMLRNNYSKPLATGTIAASGTLGILLPPSIMLVVMADLLGTSAGGLFLAAVVPSLLLACLYMLYILVRTSLNPKLAPPLVSKVDDEPLSILMVVRSFVPPLVLIIAVLGSIFGGFATPTEASGVGAFGALMLALVRGELKFQTLKDVVEQSTLTTTMLFGLFVGATAFSYVFALLGGHDQILEIIQASGTSAWVVLLILMIAVFLLGFFFDWIEITLIILPVFAPIIAHLDFGTHLPDPSMTTMWFAILMAVNLQTSFLTPPFGFALFYMKGAAGDMVSLKDIYRGIIPFVFLQISGLTAVLMWPEIALWLPGLSR